MELNVSERIILLDILPREGNVATLRIVSELRNALSFSEEENKSLSIKVDPKTNGVNWNTGADIPTEIEIGETAMGIINQSFKDRDKAGKIQAAWLPTYEKFVE